MHKWVCSKSLSFFFFNMSIFLQDSFVIKKTFFVLVPRSGIIIFNHVSMHIRWLNCMKLIRELIRAGCPCYYFHPHIIALSECSNQLFLWKQISNPCIPNLHKLLKWYNNIVCLNFVVLKWVWYKNDCFYPFLLPVKLILFVCMCVCLIYNTRTSLGSASSYIFFTDKNTMVSSRCTDPAKSAVLECR